MSTSIDAWLASAIADATRRGLPELEPLLTTLARSTAGLRAADLALDRETRAATTDANPADPASTPPSTT